MKVNEPADDPSKRAMTPELDWVLDAADARFRRHGVELFRVRSLALRVPSLLGVGGAYLASHVASMSKPLALVLLAAFVLPAIAVAPGLTVATLGAGRDRTPSGWQLIDGIGLSPGYALLSVLHFVARGIAGPLADLRLSLARFLFIDTNLGVLGALRESVKLTSGTMTAQVQLAVHASLDDITRYGFMRAGLDGRVRKTIADALVYDYLMGRFAPASAPEPTAAAGPTPAPPVARPVRHAFGAPNAIAPAAVTMPQRARIAKRAERANGKYDSSKPTCPRCLDVNLLAVKAPFALELCASCGGTWLTLDVAQSLARGAFSVKDVEVASACPTPKRGVDLTADAACPTCGAKMSRTFHLAGRVMVDACPSHGAWFDYGEIVKVARGIEQTARDRADVAELLRNPPKQTNVYVRGLGVMASEAASAALDAGKTAVDSAIEGREEEREAMFVFAAATAIEIATRDDEK